MSVNNVSLFLDVPKLNTEGVVDLLKYNKNYAGCCKIIEEKYLTARDILNLSAERLYSWKIPKWLIRSLLSLKNVLANNPETLLLPQEEEELKPHPQINNQFEHLRVEEYLVMEHNEKVTEVYYDDENYLKSSVPFETREEQRKVSTTKSPITSKRALKKPEPLPRPDEENIYEAAPPVKNKKNNNSRQINKEARRYIYQNKSEEAKKLEEKEELFVERSEENNIEEDIPPPLPKRPINLTMKTSKTGKKSFPINKNYINFEMSQAIEINISKKISDSASPAIKQNLKEQDVRVSKPHSIVNRQLPLLPEISKKPLHTARNIKHTEEESEYINEANEPKAPDEALEHFLVPNETGTKQMTPTSPPQSSRPYKSQLLSQISSAIKQRSWNTENNGISEVIENEKDYKPMTISKTPNSLTRSVPKLRETNTTKPVHSIISRPLPSLPLFSAGQINSLNNTSNSNESTKDQEYEMDSEEEMPQNYVNFEELDKPVKNQAKSVRSTKVSHQSPEEKLHKFPPIPKEILMDEDLANQLAKNISQWKSRRNDNFKTQLENSIAAPRSHMKLHLPPPPSTIPIMFTQKAIQDPVNKVDSFESDDDDDISSDEEESIGNPNNEKYFRNTDRKGAMWLLNDLEDGAFVLRPSKKYFLSLTVKKHGKYYHVGVTKEDSKIHCGEGDKQTPQFSTIKKFLAYFENNPLVLELKNGRQELYLKKVLPEDRY